VTTPALRIVPVPDRLAEQLERSVQAYRLINRLQRAARAVGVAAERAEHGHNRQSYAAAYRRYEARIQVLGRVRSEVIAYLRGLA